MLQIEGVTRRFPNGVTALDGIDLHISDGDFLVLLGPSGCGKSTLLRLIAGLDRPDAGRITWQKAAPAPGDIGFVFQDPTLMPWATAAQNAALPLRLRGRDPTPAQEMLARVGLAGFENTRPAKLSGGMRMRVSIARALAARPRLLLMDEPFAALDEFTRHSLQAELRTLAQQTGCTTIFVTHSIYEAAFLAQRVVLMSPRPGRIAEQHVFDQSMTDRTSADFTNRVAVLTEGASRFANAA
jgi:NitT/TauT family transport system ATP-binding protein